MNLMRACAVAGVESVVYSSTAAVYGPGGIAPIAEDHPVGTGAPYGATKLAAEWVVRRAAEAWGMRLDDVTSALGAGHADPVQPLGPAR